MNSTMDIIDVIENSKIAPKMIAIFVFVLILSGNYLGQLFPCKVQNIFDENIYVKHILGYLTLVFFVTLTIPELKNSKSLLFLTLSIYFGFLITSKTYYTYWFLIFGLLGIIYVLDKYDEAIPEKVEDKEESEGNKEESEGNKEGNKFKSMILQAQHILSFVVGILTLLGFTTYMGYKKFEYKDKFSYLTFLFGKPNCGGIHHQFPGYFKSLKYAFTY